MKRLLLLLLIINAASAYSVLQVSDNQYNMIPGEDGLIKLTFTNAGTDIAHNTKIAFIGLDDNLISSEICNACKTFSEEQNICTDYEDKCYTRVGDIYGLNSQDAVFKISIPDNVSTGSYTASFNIKYETYNLTTHETITRYIDKKLVINVNSINVKPSLIIKSISIPSKVSPGEKFNSSLIVKNNGDVKAENVVIKLSNDYIKSNINKISVGDIKAGSEKIVNYSLIVDPETKPGVYELIFDLSYSDNSNDYTSETKSGLLIDGDCDFNVFIQGINPQVITENTSISALISIANTGLINAKSVSITINPSEGIELSNIKQDFLGDLNSGDFTTTSFKFMPLKEGRVSLNITVDYLTPSGEKKSYNAINDIIIKFEKQETVKTNNYGLIIFIIVISIIFYLAFKKARK